MLKKMIAEEVAAQLAEKLSEDNLKKIIRQILFHDEPKNPSEKITANSKIKKRQKSKKKSRPNFAGDGDKTCPECGEGGHRRLYRGICRGCFNKKYPQKNSRQSKKSKITKLKSGSCAICGSTDDIAFLSSRGIHACRDRDKKCTIEAMNTFPKIPEENRSDF